MNSSLDLAKSTKCDPKTRKKQGRMQMPSEFIPSVDLCSQRPESSFYERLMEIDLFDIRSGLITDLTVEMENAQSRCWSGKEKKCETISLIVMKE